MRYPDSLLEEIRARLPLSQVVGRAVQWDRRRSQPSRGDWWACCPFHHEKTPSFHVDDRKGFYYCFGCHAKGEHFRFLMDKEGLSFTEAVRRLAEEAGVALPKPDARAEKREEERLGLLQVLEEAARFFELQLAGQGGARALAYAEERGLDAALRQRFRIGFAPDARDALFAHMQQRGVTPDMLRRCGLVVAPEDGGRPYDRFRNRLMFPIRDARGRVIAFGGRALGEARAKYLNSPETEVFHKSRVLYNLDQARGIAFERGEVIVVEGYMDVIALAGAGLEAAVAPLGTALTEGQLALLWRCAAQPVLCFDGDAAGLKAAWRALEMALPHLKAGYSLRFAFLPEGMDPDDFIREHGAAAMRGLLESADALIDFLFRHMTRGRPLRTPEERAALEAALESAVARIGDEKVRRHYHREVRERLWRLFGGAPRGAGRRRDGWQGQPPGGSSPRLKRLHGQRREATWAYQERELTCMLLARPDIAADVAEALTQLAFSDKRLDLLKSLILDIASRHETLESAALMAHLEGSPQARLARRLLAEARAPRFGAWWRMRPREAVAAFLARLDDVGRLRALEGELKMAEAAFAREPTDANLQRIEQLRAELNTVSQALAG